MFHPCQLHQKLKKQASNSATGTGTRVARVRAEYPNQLDYGRHEDSFGDDVLVFLDWSSLTWACMEPHQRVLIWSAPMEAATSTIRPCVLRRRHPISVCAVQFPLHNAAWKFIGLRAGGAKAHLGNEKSSIARCSRG